MVRSIVVLLVALSTFATAFAWGAASHAQTPPTCKTPRAAADTVFLWQRPQRRNLGFAAACLDPAGRSPKELQDLALKIKLVYDAHGAWVAIDKISDAPDFRNVDGAPQVIVHELLPDVVIEQEGSRWLWTAESLSRIEEHYQDVGALVQLASKLPATFHGVVLFGVALWQYLALLLLVAVGLVVRKLIAAVVGARLKRVGKALGAWPTRMVDVVASPAALFVTALILRVGYPQLLLPVDWSKALSSTVRVLITISFVWGAYRSVDLLALKLEERAAETDSKLDDQLVPLLRKTLKVVVLVVGVLAALQNLEFEVTTLFASVSIGGLAIGLAARDTLANFFGSVSIFVDSPFRIGDWINVEGTDGTVEEVGFRSTRMRTFYNSVVIIPNAKLADAKIDNYGMRQFRRCFCTLGLTYDTTPEQMQAFVEGCRAIVLSNPMTRKDVYEVAMSGFGNSSLDVMLYFFFECPTWTDELRERHNVFLEIMRLARDLGVSFAFPTQSLHLESMPALPASLDTAPEATSLRAIVEAYGPGGDRARPDGPTITDGGFVPKPN